MRYYRVSIKRVFNLHSASDFSEEVSEVGGGSGEYDLVREKGGPAAAGQRDVGEVIIPKYLAGQPKGKIYVTHDTFTENWLQRKLLQYAIFASC